MVISKSGYNLNGTVNFLNQSIEELIKKRQEDKSIVDKNTVEFIKDNLDKAKIKLDSSSTSLNAVKTSEKIIDEKGNVNEVLEQIKSLEEKKADILTKVNALNSIKNSVSRNIDNMIFL